MPLQVSGTVTLLQVFDMPTALRFYRDLLGFEIVARSQPSDNCGWAWLRLDHAEIMLNTAYDDGERPPSPEAGRQKAHDDTTLFFGCPDVDEAFTFLRSKGVQATEPKTAPYGMRQVWFHDADGYGLCLQRPDPASGRSLRAHPGAAEVIARLADRAAVNLGAPLTTLPWPTEPPPPELEFEK